MWYDGTEWIVLNPSTSSGGANNCTVAKSAAYYAASGTTVSCFSEADLSQYQFATDSGAANAYVLTLTAPLAGLTTGNLIWFTTTHTNTTAVTANVSGLGVKNVTKWGTTALTGGEITSGVAYLLWWDGTEWQILNPSAALTTNVLAKGSSAGTGAVNSSVTDNGTVVSTTEPVQVGAANCTVFGSGGGLCMTEGTAPTDVASTDVIYGDSTYHGPMVIPNNTQADPISYSSGTYKVVGSSASITSTNIASSANFVSGGYILNCDVIVTAVGTSPTLAVTVNWTDISGTARSKTCTTGVIGVSDNPSSQFITSNGSAAITITQTLAVSTATWTTLANVVRVQQ